MSGSALTAPAEKPMQGQSKRRMVFPDALRGIAALMVVLPHSSGIFGYWKDPSIATRAMLWAGGIGLHGVNIFFVLSGFVIAYTLRDQWISGRFFGRFVLRRSIRLDPPYWGAILLMTAYMLVHQRFGKEGVAPLPSWQTYVAHVFYLQNILGYPEINVVFWTLCIEIQFYIVYCVLLGISQRLYRRSPALAPARIVLACFYLSLLWPIGVLHGGGLTWFMPSWYRFLLGAVVWFAVEGKLPTRSAAIACAILLAVAVARQDLSAGIAGLTATAILFCAYRGKLYSWLNFRWMLWIGTISYCIYLVHVPVIGLLHPLMNRVRPSHEWVSFALLGVIYATSLAVAHLFHVLIERPSLSLAKRVKTHGPPLETQANKAAVAG